MNYDTMLDASWSPTYEFSVCPRHSVERGKQTQLSFEILDKTLMSTARQANTHPFIQTLIILGMPVSCPLTELPASWWRKRGHTETTSLDRRSGIRELQEDVADAGWSLGKAGPRCELISTVHLVKMQSLRQSGEGSQILHLKICIWTCSQRVHGTSGSYTAMQSQEL